MGWNRMGRDGMDFLFFFKVRCFHGLQCGMALYYSQRGVSACVVARLDPTNRAGKSEPWRSGKHASCSKLAASWANGEGGSTTARHGW